MKLRFLPLILLSAVVLAGCPANNRDESNSKEVSRGQVEKSPGPTEKQLVETIRAGKEASGAEAPFVEAIGRVDQLHGRLEFDGQGHLIGVDIASGRLEAADADLRLLVTLPNVKKLKLTGGRITNQGVRHISRMTGLVDLTLQNTQMDDDGLALLAGLPRLRSLNLRNTANLTDAALEHLKKFPALTHLHLADNRFSAEGIAQLGEFDALQLLDLRGCGNVGDAELGHFRRLAKLRMLKIGGSGVTDAGMSVVAQMTSLTGLAVDNASISNAGLAEIRDLAIEDLSLFRCPGISDEGLAHLAGFANLRRLTLRDILSINGRGLVHIRDKRKLTSLNLSETDVNDDAMVHLGGLSELTRLELRQTWITDASLEIIGGLSKLTYLDLQDAGITDAGVRHLAKLGNLETFVLRLNSSITDASAEHLAKLTNLKLLQLDQTGITSAGIQRLRKALPDCDLGTGIN